MTRSFRRTLAVRFAATMAAGLVVLSAAYLSPFWRLQGHVLLAHILVVVLATGATLIGAWWLAGSAVRPVVEITTQATQIEAGTLDQRIVAHADTEEYRGLVAVLNRMLERSPREYQLVLRSALEEIDRLTTMCEDLLLITRVESHQLAPQRAPTDLRDVVRRTLAQLHRRIEEKDLNVEESLGGAGHAVSLDLALVSRLVDHLLDNAVKYAPVGGRIAVSTEANPSAPGVRVAVENSGSHIEPEDLPHIFEPFYRVDQARSRGTGTGLGLALVAAIARLHGGTARGRNRSGHGVRFEVDLPAPTSP